MTTTPSPEPPTELPPLLTAALKLQEENDLSRLFLPKRNLCSEVYLPVSEKPCSLPPPDPKPMTKYNRTIRTIIITPSDDTDSPIFSEKAISVSVEDEAGGPFIVLRTNDEVSGRGEIRLDVEELEEAAKVARELMEQEVLKWPLKELSQGSSQLPLGVVE